MVNIKQVLTNLLKLLVRKTATNHFSGELKNQYDAVAIGAFSGTFSNVSTFVTSIRYSSGAIGTVKFSANETIQNVTISAGDYDYIYIPHRSGGKNGQADRDNHSYGNLLLAGAVPFSSGSNISYAVYDIRISGNTIASVYDISVLGGTTGYTYITNKNNTTNYEIYSTSSNKVIRMGRLVLVSFYIKCTTPVKWTSTAAITGLPAPYDGKEVYGGLGSTSTNTTYTKTSVSVAIQSDGSVKFGGGHAGVNYAGLVYYIAA